MGDIDLLDDRIADISDTAERVHNKHLGHAPPRSWDTCSYVRQSKPFEVAGTPENDVPADHSSSILGRD